MKIAKAFLLLSCLILLNEAEQINKQQKRALQKSHEKTPAQKWSDAFFGRNLEFNQVSSLVNLINKIAFEYLRGCHTIILYDRAVEASDSLLLQQLFKTFPFEYSHGKITSKYKVESNSILKVSDKCISYVLFMADIMRCTSVIGQQNSRRVIAIARSSQWRVHEFLTNDVSHSIVNLLVIVKSEKIVPVGEELPYILYTHKLYVDGIGSSLPLVLTSWREGALTRPHVSLFPIKIAEGFAGHRFIVSVGHQPPFVIKRGTDENDDISWDGIEIRFLQLIAQIYNFTTDFREAADYLEVGPAEAVAKEVAKSKANIGLSGFYMTPERLGMIDYSQYHSQDCAAFVTLTSTALPRYRAIMGPFHWTVWLTLTFIYLFAIFPIAFSDKHTLSNLLETPEEIENMFWYVFGTFTNCFTFSGKNSWNKSTKMATRLLIGFYWIFTIIVTACYTGSIIAFVTLPIYPDTIDTIEQLLDGSYRIGSLDKGGWEYWYDNVTDPTAIKLLEKRDFVPDIESGLRNTTRAFFWGYSLLASRAQMDFIIRTNFTTGSKRAILHISDECLAHYSIGMVFTPESIYKSVIDMGILRAVQSGFLIKMTHDIEWQIMRSATGKLLAANAASKSQVLTVEDRALTLDDTQGMFLLLGAGFLAGTASLISEWLGGCFNFCKRIRKRSNSIASNPRSYDVPTPREKLNSVQFSKSNNPGQFLEEFIDEERSVECKSSNVVECVVHSNNGEDGGSSRSSGDTDSTDFEKEIDKLFSLDEIFGEMNDETGNGGEDLEEDHVEKKKE